MAGPPCSKTRLPSSQAALGDRTAAWPGCLVEKSDCRVASKPYKPDTPGKQTDRVKKKKKKKEKRKEGKGEKKTEERRIEKRREKERKGEEEEGRREEDTGRKRAKKRAGERKPREKRNASFETKISSFPQDPDSRP